MVQVVVADLLAKRSEQMSLYAAMQFYFQGRACISNSISGRSRARTPVAELHRAAYVILISLKSVTSFLIKTALLRPWDDAILHALFAESYKEVETYYYVKIKGRTIRPSTITSLRLKCFPCTGKKSFGSAVQTLKKFDNIKYSEFYWIFTWMKSLFI